MSRHLLSKGEILAKYKGQRTPCDMWTRVMGYYRPAVLWERATSGAPVKGSSFNTGKQGEFKERKFFKTI